MHNRALKRDARQSPIHISRPFVRALAVAASVSICRNCMSALDIASKVKCSSPKALLARLLIYSLKPKARFVCRMVAVAPLNVENQPDNSHSGLLSGTLTQHQQCRQTQEAGSWAKLTRLSSATLPRPCARTAAVVLYAQVYVAILHLHPRARPWLWQLAESERSRPHRHTCRSIRSSTHEAADHSRTPLQSPVSSISPIVRRTGTFTQHQTSPAARQRMESLCS